MRKRCSEFWDEVVALAEGGESPEARAHVAGCPDCASKLKQLETMFSLGDLRFYDAPQKLIADVKNLMPSAARRQASLLRSTLQWSGARAVAEDFQIVVGDADSQVRLMFVRSGSGWEVLGRLPDPAWTVMREGRELSADPQGRFSFTAADLSHTAFSLVSGERHIDVPSAQELLSSGSHDAS